MIDSVQTMQKMLHYIKRFSFDKNQVFFPKLLYIFKKKPSELRWFRGLTVFPAKKSLNKYYIILDKSCIELSFF